MEERFRYSASDSQQRYVKRVNTRVGWLGLGVDSTREYLLTTSVTINVFFVISKVRSGISSSRRCIPSTLIPPRMQSRSILSGNTPNPQSSATLFRLAKKFAAGFPARGVRGLNIKLATNSACFGEKCLPSHQKWFLGSLLMASKKRDDYEATYMTPDHYT